MSKKSWFRFYLDAARFKKYRIDMLRRQLASDPEGFGEVSYSQEGEDMLLRHFVDMKSPGAFVDIGAHHPVRFSNTYYFYLRGWRGLNIDAAKPAIDALHKLRPDDINFQCAVSDVNGEVEFIQMNEPGVSTCDESLAKRFESEHGWKIIRRDIVKTRTLSSLLVEFWPHGKNIDFMNIDVEGFDLKVIKSNNWDKYRPQFLLIENLWESVTEVLESEQNKFLVDKGYSLLTRGCRTSIYKRN